MKPNPSSRTDQAAPASNPLPELWATRPAIQNRVTIFTDSKTRRVICTLLNADRITPADIKLILAAPRLARALLRLRMEQRRAENWDQFSSQSMQAALQEADEALAAAGVE